ncbi:MAG: hypothetical protein R3F17_00370 [Planctomycetota bacterium]
MLDGLRLKDDVDYNMGLDILFEALAKPPRPSPRTPVSKAPSSCTACCASAKPATASTP